MITMYHELYNCEQPVLLSKKAAKKHSSLFIHDVKYTLNGVPWASQLGTNFFAAQKAT
jgi:hypothetical protein